MIAVVGCGGNRDQHKRPLMARTAYELADSVVFTTDNPRNEDPDLIIDAMWHALPSELEKPVKRISDRRNAIISACLEAEVDDIVVIAGKGHENYQEVKGERIPFSDFDVIADAFSKG